MKEVIRRRDIRLFRICPIPCWMISADLPKFTSTADVIMPKTWQCPLNIHMEKLTMHPPSVRCVLLWKKGQQLTVVDMQGGAGLHPHLLQPDDKSEYLSSGRTIDYEETIYLTKGHPFYFLQSQPDHVRYGGRYRRPHHFLLTPCSADMFRIIYGHAHPHRGCFGNLCEALKGYGIRPDDIPVTFNIFMHVAVNGATGKLSVLPPKSKAGDHITLLAQDGSWLA